MWPNIKILLRAKYLAQNLNPCIFYLPIGAVGKKLKTFKNLQEVKFRKHKLIVHVY